MGEPNSPYQPGYGQSYEPGYYPPGPYGQPYPAQPTYGLPAGTPTSGMPASLSPVSGPLVPVPTTMPYYPATEVVITQIGDIQVTSTMIRTPAGQFPLRGSQWSISDQWVASQKTPTWAVVLAIVGFFCLALLSLLFLLAKETVYHGTVQVQVSNGPHVYVTRLPVTSQLVVHQIYQQVNYVRSLSTMM